MTTESIVRDTGNFSFIKGRIAKGCEYCIKGEKLVLFITGLCPLKCFYCPVSDKKIYKDVIYANEWKIEDIKDMLEEVKLTKAKGAGITGGDPLMVVDRVCYYIKILKKEFGKDFHIHLYTPLKLVTEERLKNLYEAGLDEIRFHLDLYDKSLWLRINLANKYDWDVGVEIPCIPGMKKEIIELIDYVKDKVKFLNLNELELSEKNSDEFKKRGFKTKNDVSYAIKQSQELAREILEENKDVPITLYFCTAKLKDKVQMKNRIIRRAISIRKKFDIMTNEGTLIRGCIYLSDLAPGFGYRKKLEIVNKQKHITKLNNTRNDLISKLDISEDSIFIDDIKLRIIIDPKIARKYSSEIKKSKLIPAIVEEYPTRDAIEMDVQFL